MEMMMLYNIEENDYVYIVVMMRALIVKLWWWREW